MALDSDAGVGVGTPVPPGGAPSTIPDALPRSCVGLARYAKLINYEEEAFFGVATGQNDYGHWKPYERDNVAYYLSEAQSEIERVTEFPLCPTYFTDERHDYQTYLFTDWNKVIEIGVEATDDIEAPSVIDYSTEPATVGPMATTVTDTSEVHVYYPDSDREIEIYRIQITGGQLTIWIPRARLVDPDWLDNQPDNGYEYDDLSYFTGSVDVVRVYTDGSTQGETVWSHGTSTSGCPACAGDTDTACLTVLNGEIGEIDSIPATYSGGAWTATSWSCYCHMPDIVRVNYLAGLPAITPQAENAVVRLAHAKMPGSPCNADPPTFVWTRDSNVPRSLTADRINCQFGMSDGAWTAYMFARSMKVIRGHTL